MKDIGGKTFVILPAKSGSVYEGLRALWLDTFGGPPEDVDAFYENFGDDIRGYAMVDEAGKVCSALTCHLCGEYGGRPVYVSYAVCTRRDMRGHGLAAELISTVRDEVIEAGGISIISPAEPSLVQYYAKLGYEPHFFMAEKTVMSPEFDEEEFDELEGFEEFGDPDAPPLRAEFDLEPLTPERYNEYREAFLAGRPHIKPTATMLRVMQAESLNNNGMYSVNRGDAICIVGEVSPERVALTELIINPALQQLSADIDAEIASLAAKRFGAAEAVFITPGEGTCQGMACGLPAEVRSEVKSEAKSEEDICGEPYYGFPIP